MDLRSCHIKKAIYIVKKASCFVIPNGIISVTHQNAHMSCHTKKAFCVVIPKTFYILIPKGILSCHTKRTVS